MRRGVEGLCRRRGGTVGALLSSMNNATDTTKIIAATGQDKGHYRVLAGTVNHCWTYRFSFKTMTDAVAKRDELHRQMLFAIVA